MRLISSVVGMQRRALDWRRRSINVGLVPTMGFLHAGHLSLIQRARRLVGKEGCVVVSVFVNPTQFAPQEDFSRYPRDLKRDRALCREAGVDVLFVPSTEEIYAPGSSSWVVEEELSQTMEGRARPTHFRGVTTIVAKLFNLVLPDIAVFGAKDFQQAAVVRRMVRDLNFPVRIVVAPTAREKDGLARSSRNKNLSGNERRQAVILFELIRTARSAVAAGPMDAGQLRRQLARVVKTRPAARLDYIEFFDPRTLRPVPRAGRGTQMALAVFVGKTRLIDNGKL